jgi:hypothetical protein
MERNDHEAALQQMAAFLKQFMKDPAGTVVETRIRMGQATGTGKEDKAKPTFEGNKSWQNGDCGLQKRCGC